jgi:hypothetical protein
MWWKPHSCRTCTALHTLLTAGRASPLSPEIGSKELRTAQASAVLNTQNNGQQQLVPSVSRNACDSGSTERSHKPEGIFASSHRNLACTVAPALSESLKLAELHISAVTTGKMPASSAMLFSKISVTYTQSVNRQPDLDFNSEAPHFPQGRHSPASHHPAMRHHTGEL